MHKIDATKIALAVVAYGGVCTDVAFRPALTAMFGASALTVVALVSLAAGIAREYVSTHAAPTAPEGTQPAFVPDPAPAIVEPADVTAKNQEVFAPLHSSQANREHL